MRSSLLFTLITSFPALAQIPYGGFEAWSSVADWEDPDGWSTMNALTYPDLSCAEGNPGAAGASFAKVTTHNVSGLGVIPGVIFAGTNEDPGFPCDQRPSALTGQWQFSMQGGDVGYITVDLSRWNPDINFSEPVGTGFTYMSGAMPQWQPFSIPITYASALDPDTAHIQIISSLGAATDGSTLWVDDLQFTSGVGMVEEAMVPEFEMRPSPTFDLLTVLAHEPLQEVLVLDLSGRELGRDVPAQGVVNVGVAELPTGLYVIRVRFRDGRSASRAFVKP